MIILTLDSSGDTFGCSINKNELVIAEITARRPRKQLSFLAKIITDTIDLAGITNPEIDLIAVTNGPGSFTGLRLALSSAKTMAQILDKEIAEINTLDAIAENLPTSDQITAIALDARREEIFCSFYKDENNHKIRISNYLALSKEDFILEAKKYNKLRITGNANEKYGDFFSKEISAVILPCHYQNPTGYSIGKIALNKKSRNEICKWHQASVFYMRKPEAQETREKRLK